jgi:hypothetical protein
MEEEHVEKKAGGGKAKKIVVIVSIVVIAAAAAAFILLSGGKESDEPLFIRALRSVVPAQKAYKAEHGTYGTMDQLKAAGVIDRTLATAIAPDCRPWYLYTVTVEGDKYWFCVARPTRWGVDGRQNAFISLDGVVYVNDKENDSEFTKKLGE